MSPVRHSIVDNNMHCIHYSLRNWGPGSSIVSSVYQIHNEFIKNPPRPIKPSATCDFTQKLSTLSKRELKEMTQEDKLAIVYQEKGIKDLLKDKETLFNEIKTLAQENTDVYAKQAQESKATYDQKLQEYYEIKEVFVKNLESQEQKQVKLT